MRFYFFRDILRYDLVQVGIGLVDLFDTMMDKGDQVDGVTYADDDARAVLGMLQTGTDAKIELIHILGFGRQI